MQKSVVGFVLFLMYIDDLGKLLLRYGITVKLFARDVKVYLEIPGPEDVVQLQKAFRCNSYMYILVNGSYLCLSVNVIYLLLASLVMKLIIILMVLNYQVAPHAVILALKLRLTCSQRNIYMILYYRPKSFIFGEITLLVKAFVVYVHPILEYNSIIWSPCMKTEIDLIEKVQKRFTKR